MKFAPAAALAVALGAAGPGAAAPGGFFRPELSAPPPRSVGVEMPAAGIDGAQGLAVRTAIGLAGVPLVARDSARGGFQNPHRDEGLDNDVDVRTAPALITGFAADPRIVAAIGGLRRRVGDADAAAQARGLPLIVLARWSHNDGNPAAYCLCASPARLVAFARTTAAARFGPRLLLVLVGAAGALEPVWHSRWGPQPIARASGAAGDVARTRRRARDFDAVLVIADERPATLWRAPAFDRWFDAPYLRDLGHRDFASIPAAAPSGSVVTIENALAAGPARAAFERRFHAAAGFLPGDAATRAFAAAQILRVAGTTRAAIRRALGTRWFGTAAGSVRFDADGFSRPFPRLVVK